MSNTKKQSSFRGFLARLGAWCAETVETHPFLSCLTLGSVMNFIIYLLHARSVIGGLGLIVAEPLYFLFNVQIVVTSFALMLVFKRRIFAFSLMSIVWLAIGVTNFVLLGMRISPLTGIDFYIVKNGILLWPTYMAPVGIAFTLIGIAAAIALLVLLFIKSPKIKIDYVRMLLTVLCCLVALVLTVLGVVGLADTDAHYMEDLKGASDTYGFPYFFLRSIFDRGISMPENYSEEELRELVADLASREEIAPTHTPNVIFVQMESFFDVTRLEGFTYSENPIPNITALREEGSYGFLAVPALGGGTANTEFEVLTGLDLSLFGTGEYPYQSVLGEQCCETVAYNLSALGYTAHGMHNHTGTFYDRYLVYSNLGFDTFTSVEHMLNVTYTATGWEKDDVLTNYIMKALTSTEGQDFVFAVSVQGHGGYPDVKLPNTDYAISVESAVEDEDWNNAFLYYVNQIHEMDAFVGVLIEALSTIDEETVLVLYGDHLPAIEFPEGAMREGGTLDTEYLIWSNFEMERTVKDLEAYQLSSFVLSKLDISNGLINKIHQLHAGDSDYVNMLALAGYDMLYGDHFAFGGTLPYTKRATTMGLEPFSVHGVREEDEETVTVYGEGFTPFSHVFVNGEKMDTEYVSESQLTVYDYHPEDGDEIMVVQISKDFRKLAKTEPYTAQHLS